jgi:hypothetical protein
MLRHFLERDVRDHALLWIALLGITGVAGLVSWTSVGRGAWYPLFYVYLLFGVALSSSLVGGVWRTQYGLSRYYLLALPIAHRRLFALQQARMLLPWVPLTGLAGLAPLLAIVPVASSWPSRGLYYTGVIASVGLVVQWGMWATLEQERIAAYLPKGARFRAYSRLFLVVLAVWLPLMEAWMELIAGRDWLLPHLLGFRFRRPAASIVFPAGLIALVFWLRHNARRWCVTL